MNEKWSMNVECIIYIYSSLIMNILLTGQQSENELKKDK